MSIVTVITIIFIISLLLGVPVAVSLGTSSLIGVVLAGIPLQYVAQTVFDAINDFTVIAVPMFIFAGAVMEKGGLTEKLVDFTSRQLTPPSERVLPIGIEKTSVLYYRRYICRKINGVESCYAVGIRDPFQNHRTPVWLRFHKETGYFAEISQQLNQSSLEFEGVRSGKHI